MKTILKICFVAASFLFFQKGAAQTTSKIAGTALYDSCAGDYVITQWSQFNFKADRTSHLKTMTTKTSGTIQIAAGYSTVISAQKEIHLLPGFSAVKGSQMRAYIDPAPCTPYKPITLPNTSSTGILLYPNPTNGLFVVAIPPATKSITLFDIFITTADGMPLQQKLSQPAGIINFNLQQYTRGMYFLRIVNRSTGQSQFQKVILL